MGLGAKAPPRLSARAARIVLSLVTLAAAGACTKPPGEPDVAPGEELTFPARASIRIATGEVQSIDPLEIEALDELTVAEQVYDGLVAYDPATARTIPGAAQSWGVSDGGRRFVFHLRDGARFHDGSSVDAEDFVFAWNRLADPVAVAPFSFLLEAVSGYGSYQSDVRVRGLEGIRAVDAQTFEVVLGKPWPDFVSLLGHPALSPVPSERTGAVGAELTPIGNGPYRLSEAVTPGEDIRLTRFDEHFGPAPGIDRLVFRPFDEANDAWPEFLADDLEIAPIPTSVLPDAEGRYGAGGIRPVTRLLYCGFRRDDPRFRHRELRRAVSVAIDRTELATSVYAGLAVPATGIVPPGIPGYGAEACGVLCRQQIESARKLVRQVPRHDRAFALDYTASEVGNRLAGTLTEQLEAVGLDVNARGHDARGYAELLQEDKQELFCLVWVADSPRQQAMLEPLLLSTSPDNQAGIELSALDRLLVEARGSGAPTERIELYRRAEELALSAMHLVPLVWFRSHLAAKPYVDGFRVSPLGTFDATELRIHTGD